MKFAIGAFVTLFHIALVMACQAKPSPQLTLPKAEIKESTIVIAKPKPTPVQRTQKVAATAPKKKAPAPKKKVVAPAPAKPAPSKKVIAAAPVKVSQESLALYLQKHLQLPEKGSVKVAIDFLPGGKVAKSVILSSQSDENSAYLIEKLASLSLPGVGAETITITFCNDD